MMGQPLVKFAARPTQQSAPPGQKEGQTRYWPPEQHTFLTEGPQKSTLTTAT